MFWHEKDLQMLKSVKKSIVEKKSTPHFGASGQYFSFSMNALYKIDHKNSSIGLYGSKKGKDDCLSFIEEKMSVILEHAVLSQSELFHHCSNMLSPVMDVAEGLQDEYGDINVQPGRLGDLGLYSAQTCVNAFTHDFHTEFDQGPTLICVPD